MTYVTLYLTKLQGYTRGDIYPGTMAPGSRAAARGYLGGQVRAPCSWGPGGRLYADPPRYIALGHLKNTGIFSNREVDDIQ